MFKDKNYKDVNFMCFSFRSIVEMKETPGLKLINDLTLFHMGYFFDILAWGGAFFTPPLFL